MKDVHFNVNKDVYGNHLIDEDEIKILKVVEGPKPTIVALSVENNGGSTKHNARVIPSHFGDANEQLAMSRRKLWQTFNLKKFHD